MKEDADMISTSSSDNLAAMQSPRLRIVHSKRVGGRISAISPKRAARRQR